MFLPKEKKSNHSKMLTEAEIKKKLYGEFDAGSSRAPITKTGGSSFSSSDGKKAEFASSRSFAAVPTGLSSAGPAKPSYEAAPAKSTSHDFSAKPAFSTARQPVVDSATSSPQKKKGSQSFRKGVNAVLGFFAGILWKLGAYFVQFLAFILKILDPRKPQARRLLYSITACVLVAALFVGVFRLNAQRKKAMLGEIPRATAVQTPLVSSAPVVEAAKVPAVTVDLTDATSEAIQKEESQEMILKALENSSGGSLSAVAPPVSAGKYVIQVATYVLVEDANRVIESLKQAGFESFYKKQIRNSTGNTFYTVCLGRFESYPLAQENLAKFRKAAVARPFQDAFIRTLE